MFERPHHRRIEQVLQAFDPDVLKECQCFFGGGTAIVLALSEYRESNDVDFLCASQEGYRSLRNLVSTRSLGVLLKSPLTLLRDVRADRYGIRTILEVEGTPVKIEIVSEGRISIAPDPYPVFSVPTLSRQDMYAEKLLANADRGMDHSVMSRDIIDLAAMIDRWGDIPPEAWAKVDRAYGPHATRAFRASYDLIRNPDHLRECLRSMRMDEAWLEKIPEVLSRCDRIEPEPITKMRP